MLAATRARHHRRREVCCTFRHAPAHGLRSGVLRGVFQGLMHTTFFAHTHIHAHTYMDVFAFLSESLCYLHRHHQRFEKGLLRPPPPTLPLLCPLPLLFLVRAWSFWGECAAAVAALRLVRRALPPPPPLSKVPFPECVGVVKASEFAAAFFVAAF